MTHCPRLGSSARARAFTFEIAEDVVLRSKFKEEANFVAAIATTCAGQAQTNDRLEMAETRTNYAPHVSGKDITSKDSIHGETLRAVTFQLFGLAAGVIRRTRKISPCIESLFVISFPDTCDA